MALFNKHKTPRRREVRRTAAKPKPAWWHALFQQRVGVALLHLLAFTALAGLVALAGRDRLPFREGQPVTRPYWARVQFVSIDKEATERKRQIAQNESPSVYKANPEYFTWLEGQLGNLMGLASDASIQTAEHVSQEVRDNWKINDRVLAQLRTFVVDGQPSEQWPNLVRNVVDLVASWQVLAPADAHRERSNQAPQIAVVSPAGRERLEWKSKILSTNEYDRFHANVRDVLGELPLLRYKEDLRESIMALIARRPGGAALPTYLLDEAESLRRREQAVKAVQDEPREFHPNALLVDTNPQASTRGSEEVRSFDDADLKLIRQERQAYKESLGAFNLTLRNVGVVGLVFIGALAFWVYITTYYPRVAQNPLRGIAIVTLALICQAAAFGLTALGPEMLYVGAIFPTLLAAMVITIAYDQRFALTFGSLHALLVTLTLNLPLGFALVLLLGVASVIVQLREVRTRSKLVTVGVVSGLIMAVATILVGFIDRPLHIPGENGRIVRDAILTLATAFGAGLFVHGILQPIEKLFKVSTAMTLKDLSDFSHPLLRRLAERAPGTWRHSLALADMAESAANAINGDSLLCRVGAMYHDIGKLNKPMYFVENQGGGPNRHDKLSPAMSVLIIVGHVKDGVEMAREYHLPAVIRHFIESHHGTTLVEYFYHAAKKQKEADDQPLPSEFEFRYPGPKPQTKEAAIIMLCDGVEGAARTTADPMPARLEQLVHHMAMKRLMDGQFNQCNLTLAELHSIEDAVTKALCAMYHGRIAYPSDDRRDEGGKTAPAEPQERPASAIA